MDQNELRERILQYFDGDLSTEEETALAAVLREDAEARKLLGVLARLHAQLPEAMRLSETLDRSAASSAPQAAPAKRLRITRRTWWTPHARSRWSLAAAASVFAAAGLVYLLSAPQKGQTPESGKVVRGVPASAAKDLEAAPQGTPPPELPSPAGAGKDPGPKPVPIPTPEPKLPPPQRPPAPALPQTPPEPPATPPVEPPKPPQPVPVLTEAAVATVEQAEGDVHLLVGGNRIAARRGHQLLAGQGLEVGATGGAVVSYPDRTRLEAGPGTVVREMGPHGRRVYVARGRVAAEVAKQPKDQPMVFVTPHGEATVLGTTLRILVDPNAKNGTRLEVEEGKVRLKNLAGKTVDVSSGQFAVAVAGAEVEMAARSISIVGSWGFEEGSGTTAHDSSGLGNTAALLNGPVWTPGRTGQGLRFDGIDDYLSVPHSVPLDLGAAGKAFTVSLWYRRGANPTDLGGILCKGDGAGPVPFALTAGSNTGRVTFVIVGAGGQRSEIVSRRRVADDAWHHIAAVRDTALGVLRLYVDGVEDAAPAGDTAGEARNAEPIWVARCPYGSKLLHDSIVADEIRIFNRALGAAEVARHVLGKDR